ncbi:uncharacterized protein LOC124931713 [Impatiens glandulifera]|uniref:uncharacterized protein LOC124931713 n=1 Tax=Impatiens glandulifera TaxID=253017 RepID=UPI001FB1617D|nr:uncharacterized protein LOC124931713 [Impatiens glandulifera]
MSKGAGSSGAQQNNGIFHYPQLTHTNYISWVIRVQAMMEDQGVWEAVESVEGTEIDVRLDKKARSHLLQALPEDLLMQVANKKTAKEVWDCLKTRFVGADRVKNARLQTLKSEFDRMHMNDSESLDQYAGRLTSISVRYSSLGETLNDIAIVKKLFDTVPERFISVVAGIEQFYNLETLTFEEAVGRLKVFEERTRKKNTNFGGNEGQVLLTQEEWKARFKKDEEDSLNQWKKDSTDSGTRGQGGRTRGRGQGRGGRGAPSRKDKEGGSGGRGAPRDKSHIRCFNCNEMGHYSTQCRAKKNEVSHLTHADNVEPALLMAISEEIPPINVVMLNEMKTPEILEAKNDETSRDAWFLDNGASNHMTGDKEKFFELDEAVTGKVKFGDGSTVQICGKGSIMFECKNGDQWLLEGVFSFLL